MKLDEIKKKTLKNDFVIAKNLGIDFKHPAKFTDSFFKEFSNILKLNKKENKIILDVFGGTGKIGKIKEFIECTVITNEIQEEWASMSYKNNVDIPLLGDSCDLKIKDEVIDCIITSPTYGNRMADSHNAKDGSKRNTYTHTLGKKLEEQNTGKMQFGKKYLEMHEKVYKECYRVLKENGLMVVNLKNFIKKGEIIDVVGSHLEILMENGFELHENRKIPVKGNGFGANREKRVEYENILVLRKVV